MSRRSRRGERGRIDTAGDAGAEQSPIPGVIPSSPTPLELPLGEEAKTRPWGDRPATPTTPPGPNESEPQSEPDQRQTAETADQAPPERLDAAPSMSDGAALSIEPSATERARIPDPEHPIFSRMAALRFVRVNHSAVFLLYAVLGVALLLSVKSLHAQFDILLYFAVVGAIMGSYFLVNMIDFAGLRLRYDQLGDNLYYLGFIYTLGTLTHTLYIFEGTAANISEVISSFGIALSSTVLGVVLRIVAHLMRIDPHEVEDTVRTELVDLTSRVRASLDNVVRDMTIFGDQTRQVIKELRDDTSQDMSESGEKLVTASNRILEFVDQSFRVFTENTTRMNRLSEQTVEMLTALVGKIQAIEAPSDLIERKLLPATNQIERVVAVMAEISRQEVERAEQLRGVTESMNAAIASVREHVNLISSAASQKEIAERVTVAGNALKDMSGFVVSLRDQMKTLVDSETAAVASLRIEFESAVGNIRNQNAMAKTELDKFRSLTAQTQDSLIELARALRKAV